MEIILYLCILTASFILNLVKQLTGIGTLPEDKNFSELIIMINDQTDHYHCS